jgi:chloramphenicol 3-O phosphotransferase
VVAVSEAEPPTTSWPGSWRRRAWTPDPARYALPSSASRRARDANGNEGQTPNMREPGRAIILAGTSGSGKSTTAEELRRLLPDPFLVLGLDTFFGMLPLRWTSEGTASAEGFSYLRDTDPRDGRPRLRIAYGPVGARMLAGMRACVDALLREGNNVIVDDMPIDDSIMPAWHRDLRDRHVSWVRVHAPLPVLEEREADRFPERFRGLSRGHYHVCVPDDFDLDVDSAELDPAERARHIAAALRPAADTTSSPPARPGRA